MLLGFKRRFEPMIVDHSKTHTIRGLRKITPRVGETCHCYVDPRQKTMKLLGRWPCVKVERITMDRGRFFHPNEREPISVLDIWVDGEILLQDEVEAFLLRDGFRDQEWKVARGRTARGAAYRYPATEQALEFWRQRLPFRGHIIHWNPEVNL